MFCPNKFSWDIFQDLFRDLHMNFSQDIFHKFSRNFSLSFSRGSSSKFSAIPPSSVLLRIYPDDLLRITPRASTGIIPGISNVSRIFSRDCSFLLLLLQEISVSFLLDFLPKFHIQHFSWRCLSQFFFRAIPGFFALFTRFFIVILVIFFKAFLGIISWALFRIPSKNSSEILGLLFDF